MKHSVLIVYYIVHSTHEVHIKIELSVYFIHYYDFKFCNCDGYGKLLDMRAEYHTGLDTYVGATLVIFAELVDFCSFNFYNYCCCEYHLPNVIERNNNNNNVNEH